MTTPDNFWQNVIQWTISQGGKFNFLKQRSDIRKEVPRPELCSFLKKDIGELKGQMADWRASLPNTVKGFHAVEFKDRYKCHIDKKDPFKDPIGHLVQDSPGTLAGIIFVGVAIVVGGVLIFTFVKKGKKNREEAD